MSQKQSKKSHRSLRGYQLLMQFNSLNLKYVEVWFSGSFVYFFVYYPVKSFHPRSQEPGKLLTSHDNHSYIGVDVELGHLLPTLSSSMDSGPYSSERAVSLSPRRAHSGVLQVMQGMGSYKHMCRTPLWIALYVEDTLEELALAKETCKYLIFLMSEAILI